MSLETHPGDPRLPRLADEDLGNYMERYSVWLKQFKPWEATTPIEPPKEQAWMPYADREPGSDDE